MKEMFYTLIVLVATPMSLFNKLIKMSLKIGGFCCLYTIIFRDKYFIVYELYLNEADV